MNITEQTRSLAWRQMFIKRCCPSIGVLKKGGVQVEKHLASCAACRALMKNMEIYKKGGADLVRLSLGKTDQTPIVPGDIRRIRPLGEPSAWFDANGRYHNPPLALILDEPDEDGFVRVAQVFSDPLLAAEGDLDLGEAGFAECWNIYGLPVFGLADKAYQKVDRELARRVLESDGLDSPPLGAMSVLRQFRLCELETGAFFSMALNAEAMERLNASAGEDAETGMLAALNKFLANTFKDGSDYSILPPIGDNQDGWALAAATASRTIALPEDNECVIDLDKGVISYAVDFLPSRQIFAVGLTLEGILVPVRDENGIESDFVALQSDATIERHCGLTNAQFHDCGIKIYPIQRKESSKKA